MNQFIALEDIDQVLRRERLLPTVVMWNRLEGRPRREDFLRALRAEVRDPLWMLCKQWQVGEFRGDDAGSPVFAKVHIDITRITRYQPGDAQPGDFDDQTPLEAKVEQRPLALSSQQQLLSFDVRLAMGRQWLKLLAAAGFGALRAAYIDHYAIASPDPTSRADAYITAHPSAWQAIEALAGRAMDGGALYLYLRADAAHRAYDGITVADADKPAFDDLADRFTAWYHGLFLQPVDEANDAWAGSQLEYRFAVSAPTSGGNKRMVADEYYQGRLDWYSLDVDPQGDPDAEAPADDPRAAFTQSFFPVNMQFDGMPNTRWWTFEDAKTNFGDIKPDTTDINKLLLMEFGLVYANDWFLLPFQLPVGSLANVAGLAVTNVFGERTWVRAAGAGADEDWQRWAMYNLAVKGHDAVAADTTLVLLPTVPKTDDGEPLDDVALVRDEVSNMVWAVERRIPLITGRGARGSEAGTELRHRYEAILDGEIEGGLVVPEIPEAAAAIRYELMQGVPEHWIPFIPVHVDGSNREIQLQRASMPRIILGDPNAAQKIKPRSLLMRQGLEQVPPEAYFLHEEEVPRAGVRIVRAFQRTRWHDGRVFVWVGVRKQTGRGEGHSELAFDRVKSTRRQLRRALRLFVTA